MFFPYSVLSQKLFPFFDVFLMLFLSFRVDLDSYFPANCNSFLQIFCFETMSAKFSAALQSTLVSLLKVIEFFLLLFCVVICVCLMTS